ncbi:polysaccharide pyruvyl transferase family protein [Promicromonospora sp. NPDC057138]|uniref:polysaccharide pyruvyl transferase family protein n=1 Tax=Promicromonospora sp. NPDC057138 TaxID=3346031 RepID=UPI00362BC6F9
MKRLRLFHFDIKTYGNYGDTLLFETVRELFEGFAGGDAFEVVQSRQLRDAVTPRLVDYINENVDAVVVGGGGLFLSDTNPNQRSGWQWNISLDLLRRIEKPLIIFAVGNNRFIDQADFADPFREHVNLTLEKSVFFGLRNHGSVETIKEYIDEKNRDRVTYQPCPTTLSSFLYPDLFKAEIPHERRIAAHSIVGKRQARAGFDAERIYTDQVDVLEKLSGEGWQVEGVPHARADMGFHDQLTERGIVSSEHVLWGNRDVLYQGIEYFADLPIILGTRGHAQMVPFGMGTIPLSLYVHHKIRYFATDIGHADWAIDPRADDFQGTLYKTINEAHERQPELRKELADVRQGFFDTSLNNLAGIYKSLTGETVTPSFRALTPPERRTAARLYDVSMRYDKLEQDNGRIKRELTKARKDLDALEVAGVDGPRRSSVTAGLRRRLRPLRKRLAGS